MSRQGGTWKEAKKGTVIYQHSEASLMAHGMGDNGAGAVTGEGQLGDGVDKPGLAKKFFERITATADKMSGRVEWQGKTYRILGAKDSKFVIYEVEIEKAGNEKAGTEKPVLMFYTEMGVSHFYDRLITDQQILKRASAVKSDKMQEADQAFCGKLVGPNQFAIRPDMLSSLPLSFFSICVSFTPKTDEEKDAENAGHDAADLATMMGGDD